MPQAIAMQLPGTTTVIPTAGATTAGTVGATGKAPMFAGLLLQFSRNAPASTPSVAEGAIGKDAGPTATAAQQSTQPEPPGLLASDQGSLLLDPTLPAVPPPAAPSAPAPASGPPGRTRLTGATHPGSAKDLTEAASPAVAQDAVAGMATPPTPILVMPPPPSAPETSRQTPADGRARGPRLEDVAAKSGATATGPAGNDTASAPTAAAATSSAVDASAAWPTAPVATTATQVSASSIQAAVAIAQPAQAAGPAPLPEPAGAASATQPDAATAAPAQQVSAALVSLAGAPGGGQRMTLRLQPAELGQVQIRIDRPQDAPAQVEITVQRPETLTLLLRDQPQLQRALDQAGVPADGRTLTLHIAAPEATASSGNANASMAAGTDPGQGGGNGSSMYSGGRDRSGDAAEQDQDHTTAPLPQWLRVGLDITA